MTQIKNTFLITIIASILVIESFALWTGVVTGSVSHRIWSSITEVPLVIHLEPEEQHAAAPELLVKQDAQEVQVQQEIQEVQEEEVSVENPSWRKGSIDDSQEEELRQWGLRSWLTLSIPSLNLNAQVYLPSDRFWNAKRWDMLEEQMQIGLMRGATAYPHSVRPGERGTIFISGHSSPPTADVAKSAYGSLFSQLPSMQPGGSIFLANNGESIEYQVVSSAVVQPQDTEILLQQYESNLIKLITCYPVGTTRDRLIVTAREV